MQWDPIVVEEYAIAVYLCEIWLNGDLKPLEKNGVSMSFHGRSGYDPTVCIDEIKPKDFFFLMWRGTRL